MRHNLGSRRAHKLFLAFRIGFWGRRSDPTESTGLERFLVK
jgi:hypothetical protein